MKKYAIELTKAMEWLAKKKNTIFIGQAVKYPGTAMSGTLKNVLNSKLYELPVTEEMQMGVSLGLAMNGSIPISIYPRWNFLLCAMNQLINHLDKVNIMSDQKFQNKIIIRTGIGSEFPLHPQYQHIGDYTEAIQKMCTNIEIIKLDEPTEILPAYKKAFERKDKKITICVEYGDFYNTK